MILYYFIIAALLSIVAVFVKLRRIAKVVIITFAVVQAAFSVYAFMHIGQTELRYFTYDALGVLFLLVLSLIFPASVYHGFRYFKNRITHRFFYYHAALIGLITAITGAYLANEATVVWILVEATTLCASVLIYHEKTKYSLEATWKYIFLCSVGIAFAYMGILFLSISMHHAGSIDLSFAAIAAAASMADPIYLKIAFVFIFIGYSTKMEVFPMHTVGIDANSVAPSPIGALISSAMVNMGFVIVYRMYAALSGTPIFSWMNHILIIAGVLSVLVAAGYMLKAKHNKRMLAYSSLEKAGLVAIALGVGGYGYYAAILLLVLHSFAKSAMFFQMGQLFRVLNTMKLDFSGHYMKFHPAGALVLIVGMFCLLAIPPSGLFITEYMMLKAMVFGNHWVVLVFIVVLLCVVIYAMSVRIMHICFSQPRETAGVLPHEKVHPAETITQFLFFAMVIAMCFYRPPFVDELIVQSVSLIAQMP